MGSPALIVRISLSLSLTYGNNSELAPLARKPAGDAVDLVAALQQEGVQGRRSKKEKGQRECGGWVTGETWGAVVARRKKKKVSCVHACNPGVLCRCCTGHLRILRTHFTLTLPKATDPWRDRLLPRLHTLHVGVFVCVSPIDRKRAMIDRSGEGPNHASEDVCSFRRRSDLLKSK